MGRLRYTSDYTSLKHCHPIGLFKSMFFWFNIRAREFAFVGFAWSQGILPSANSMWDHGRKRRYVLETNCQTSWFGYRCMSRCACASSNTDRAKSRRRVSWNVSQICFTAVPQTRWTAFTEQQPLAVSLVWFAWVFETCTITQSIQVNRSHS